AGARRRHRRRIGGHRGGRTGTRREGHERVARAVERRSHRGLGQGGRPGPRGGRPPGATAGARRPAGGDPAARAGARPAVAAVRASWPAGRPLALRFVADDRFPGGLTAADGVALARRLAEAGADLIDVAAGHTVPDAAADYRRLFNAGLADRVRNEAGVVVVVGG